MTMTPVAPRTATPTIPEQRTGGPGAKLPKIWKRQQTAPTEPDTPPEAVPEPSGGRHRAPEPSTPEPSTPQPTAEPPTRERTAGPAGQDGAESTGRHRRPVATRVAVPKPAPQRTFRPDIEGLRAVAVVTVVISHAGLALPGGYIGVDVFFVISGFLITGQLVAELRKRGRISFSKFYARRLRRIVPAATVVLVATLGASWIWLSPLRVPSITLDAMLAAVSGVNWRFAVLGTDYFQTTAPPSPLQHYWSLSVEEQFYLLWPLLLVVAALPLGRIVGRQRAILGALAVVIVGSFALSVVVTDGAAPIAYFGSHTRAWELGLGALIAVTAATWTRLPKPFAALVAWVGVAAIMWSAFNFTGQTPYPGALAAVPVVGAAMVIVGGCSASRWGAESLLARWPMQFVGRISYSWYLWHWPLLLLLPAALDSEPNPQTTLLAVAGSFGLAVASYYLVEEPFRRNHELITHPQRAIMVGSGLVAASVAAAVALALVVVVPGSNDGPPLPTVALSPESVTLATTLTALPADITPPLESAQRDEANTRNCFATWFDLEPKTGPDCVFGDPEGTRSMVLFGDSHAAQWMGPVGAWASASKVKLYFIAKPACPAGNYPDLIPAALQRVYRECNEFRGNAFEFIKQLKPDLVVIGSLSKGAAVKAEGMTDTVNVVKAAGAQVLYIADNPYMGIDPPSCLAQHPDNIQRCAVPRTAAGLDTTARLDEIRGAQEGGAQIWDPVPLMCANVCPSVIGNIVVYKDENHLTNTFTRSLLPELAPILSKLIGG